ncbi:MAG: GntR family transcriptional regulator [Pseudomonadota bacterium]
MMVQRMLLSNPFDEPTGAAHVPAQRVGGRKADLAYEILKRDILFQRRVPGAQLLEKALSQEFSCSQSTVREALLRLTEDGLVERRGHKGTTITRTGLAEATEMVRIRLSIEAAVACTIADHKTIDLSEMEPILERMAISNRAGDIYTCAELDRLFHCTLARIAGMGLLAPILQRCILHIHRFTLSGVEVPRTFFQEAGIAEEHRDLLADLVSGDGARAERAARGHIAHVLERWSPSLHFAVGREDFVDA